MKELFAEAGGAVGVDAAEVDFAFGADEGGLALGAVSGEVDFAGGGEALGGLEPGLEGLVVGVVGCCGV